MGSGTVRFTVRSLRRPSLTTAVAAGAVAVIMLALGFVGARGPSHKATSACAGISASHKKKAGQVKVISVSPGNGSTGVNGASPITVAYSGPVTAGTVMPTLSPSIAGSWRASGDKAIFTPRVGYPEDTHVKVS